MPKHGHVHFVQSLEPLQGGGLGASALQLHDAMRAASMESRLFATRESNFQNAWPEVKQFVRWGPTKAYYAPGLACAAKKALLNSALIVHGHGFYVYTNYLFGRLARQQRLPLVCHVQGTFEPWILSRSRIKKRIAHWLFEDANFKHARLWRALTNREADQIRTVVGKRAQLVVAPNGIDLSPFLTVKDRTLVRRRALFLGRLHPKKGLDLLIRAWAGMGSAAADWELVIAGPDEAGHEAEVRRWVEAAGLDGSVTFTGSVSGPAKYELLASADLFVLTSYSEGLPMAPLEAMATGVPVAITHECNLPEVAQVGAGWLCPAEMAAVGGMLNEALRADDTERRQRGAAGRRLVETAFTWQKTVATLHEACQQIQ